MNEKKQKPMFGVGGVTLLTVLLVLALTMFAVLTVSSAQADLRLSEKNARAVGEYYAADSRAVRLQAQAAALWQKGQPKPLIQAMQEKLSADYDLTVSEQGGKLWFSCAIPINDAGLQLQLELVLKPPGNGERWQVKQWQFIPPSTQIWEEPILPVWTGD